MATYGYKENFCKAEVLTKGEIENTYKVKGVISSQKITSNTYVVLQDNTEHRLAYNSSVTSSTIVLVTPSTYNDNFASKVVIDTGSISPKLSVIKATGDTTRLVCVGNAIPSFLVANSVYTVTIWYDGFSMCYSLDSYKYA